MGVLETHIDPSGEEYAANRAAMAALVEELRHKTAEAQLGGGEDAIAKHRKRGKLLARERVARLCDPGTPFLEFSTLAAWGMYGDEAPGAGIVTGIGRGRRARMRHRGERCDGQGRHVLSA